MTQETRAKVVLQQTALHHDVPEHGDCCGSFTAYKARICINIPFFLSAERKHKS